MQEELKYQLALTAIDGIGPVQAKQLVVKFGNARSVFKASAQQLEAVEGIGNTRAKAILSSDTERFAEKELEFCAKHGIACLLYGTEGYPKRLLTCPDPPMVLFYKGKADLNTNKVVSIIGTRNNSDYGRVVTETLLEGLKGKGILIVSGLALGIDTIAHRAALRTGSSTIAVLGHGLDMIYPSQNVQLAKEMLSEGGLLTEFPQKTEPEKFNFPRRNRIVAGMADATIVIETDVKGGSMITASLAFDYDRALFAVPGKLIDNRSRGCLRLVQTNRAALYISPEQFLEEMNWDEASNKKNAPVQSRLFIDLDQKETEILKLIQSGKQISKDEIMEKTGYSHGEISNALIKLEMQDLIVAKPGSFYGLLT